MGKILILGAGRSFGKTIAAELAKRNYEAIIANSEQVGSIADALSDLTIAFENFTKVTGEIPKLIYALKPPPDNQPSKYISKPRNNFKRR
jgi:predicted dinucleotide-binding enzyme